MATISRFQDLEIWKQSKLMAVKTLQTFRGNKEFNDRELIYQLIKSAVSVPSNIAEGFEREGRKEFLNFLSIAKGSNGEYLTQLIIAHEVGIIDAPDFEALSKLSTGNGYMIKKLMNYLSNSAYKGQKFHAETKEPVSIYERKDDPIQELNQFHHSGL